MVVMMVGPPGLPVTSLTRPAESRTMAGAIADSIRLSGWMALAAP